MAVSIKAQDHYLKEFNIIFLISYISANQQRSAVKGVKFYNKSHRSIIRFAPSETNYSLKLLYPNKHHAKLSGK
ncbi:5173_t:CDS:2 [Cetraspora pellucida]|uniref:5173_t:CDS:1 n=1 Tax=Cetraspora pellucida TaxID=1433469 RepID=A0A9N9GWG4_9GLOM|nr:5173_t:CDS:2 [Cetraspora pellucida]